MVKEYTLESLTTLWEDYLQKYGRKQDLLEVANAFPDRRSLTVDYREVAQFDPEVAEFLVERPKQAIYAAEHEMAVTLCDFLMRRTHILHEAQDGALLHAGALAADMGAILGWDDERMQREVAEYEKQVMLARAFR